jgi:hypothetical protein
MHDKDCGEKGEYVGQERSVKVDSWVSVQAVVLKNKIN